MTITAPSLTGPQAALLATLTTEPAPVRGSAIAVARALHALGVASFSETSHTVMLPPEPLDSPVSSGARAAANDTHTGAVVAGERESAESARIAAVEDTHTPTAAILAALDRAYVAIRLTHPEVPSAVAITLGSGGGKTHGHFLPKGWEDTDAEGRKLGHRHELNIATESLARGASQVLTTLIHESAHALAHATGVKDTARQGRYHNQKFAGLAANMGLTIESNEKIGTVTTGLNSWAEAHYAATLADLTAALTSYKLPRKAKTAEDKPKTTVRIACSCDYPVTVPVKWYTDFGIEALRCDSCGERLTPVED